MHQCVIFWGVTKFAAIQQQYRTWQPWRCLVWERVVDLCFPGWHLEGIKVRQNILHIIANGVRIIYRSHMKFRTFIYFTFKLNCLILKVDCVLNKYIIKSISHSNPVDTCIHTHTHTTCCLSFTCQLKICFSLCHFNKSECFVNRVAKPTANVSLRCFWQHWYLCQGIQFKWHFILRAFLYISGLFDLNQLI